MVSGFWKNLPRPAFVLAPMANVTDAAFRHIIAKYGKPDVIWTEFVSCDGLCSSGKESLLIDLNYSEIERPIVAQIFGSNPETYYTTALMIQELGFDGIDINMGCPDRSVSGKQASGAALIKTPRLAQEIIRETKRGAGKLPVSVKTRIGFNTDILETWLPYLLEAEPAVITVHGRTKKELSLVPARWNRIADAVKIRDSYDSSPNKTLIFGNGDVKDLSDARQKVAETGCDGVMIGRGIFGNPWLFSRTRDYKTVTVEEKLAVMIEHTALFEKLLGEHKNVAIMKKHYKAYVSGFDGAKELRVELMEAPDVVAVKQTVAAFLKKYPEVKNILPW
jgi:nifR3 family TIM-barrel protein